MVSTRTPPKPADDEAALDPARLHAALRAMAQRTRAEMLDPWKRVLAGSADLQAEVDRMVGELQVFFNKWVVEIVVVLSQRGTLRFNELKASLGGISSRTLTQRLRELEERGLVDRKLFDEMPVRVEYSLTRKGLDVAALALPLVLYLMLDAVERE